MKKHFQKRNKNFRDISFNFSGHSNALVTKEDVLNPLSKEKSVMYYHNFVFVKSLTEEMCAELKEVLTRRIKNAFIMMEFVEPIITFEETIINV